MRYDKITPQEEELLWGNLQASVVVMAYGRRQYLPEALESAVGQTLPRSAYEVICVKNFSDRRIDAFMERNGVIPLLTQEKATIGEFLTKAVARAKGGIILFLDDDDLFNRHKLERTMAIFSCNGRLGLLHNRSARRGSTRKFMERYPMEGRNIYIEKPYDCGKVMAIGNSSSIAIRREILARHMRELSHVEASPDSIFTLLAMIEGAQIMGTGSELTYCRQHGSNTASPKEMDKRIRFYREMEIPAYGYQLGIAERHRSAAGIRMASRLLAGARTWLGIAEGAEAAEVMGSSLKAGSFRSVLLGLLYLASPSAAYRRIGGRV